ncbi:hypothetical protein PCC8801_3848 [Rippkaea orientalis PCC 8801]|uniref:Uncharacterized protein n=1 Tax=Rippkaea orientalis (strain PCC 8801 / RF-1) TaxID=41431 RepID=B7K492_RIPO1|nr:hypothetical protein [Rippkaea orientalis]ACK67798.1 hypothetical protein PCC8801_3848 [Rippkaea orientalis PCC 8801]
MVQINADSVTREVRWCSPILNSDRATIPPLESNMWVRLLEPLSLFCYDEAILLCQLSEIEWIAWIPDHGESMLNIEQFCVA